MCENEYEHLMMSSFYNFLGKLYFTYFVTFIMPKKAIKRSGIFSFTPPPPKKNRPVKMTLITQASNVPSIFTKRSLDVAQG